MAGDVEATETELLPTEEIDKSGRAIYAIGVAAALATLAVAAGFLACALHIPSHCNVPLRGAELRLAICNAIISVIVLGGVLGTRKMFSNVQREARAQGLDAEGKSEEAEAERKGLGNASMFRGFVRVALCVQSVFSISCLVLQAAGVLQAYGAKRELCGTYPVVAFWPIALLNAVLIIVNSFVYKCVDV